MSRRTRLGILAVIAAWWATLLAGVLVLTDHTTLAMSCISVALLAWVLIAVCAVLDNRDQNR